jgi:DNA-directed RNA polymerase subunit RPC12/RpoP
MKCSACDHLQVHESRGYLLSESVRPFKKAIREIRNEIFLGTRDINDGPQKDGQIDCEHCGQISLVVPRSQHQHVSAWLDTNATPKWLEAAENHEPPAQIIGVCIN